MSHHMGKPTICIGKNKGAFVFATRITQFLFYLNPKFQASSSFLCLYRPVCVGPVRKPHCWFSHEAAHMSGPTADFITMKKQVTNIYIHVHKFRLLQNFTKHWRLCLIGRRIQNLISLRYLAHAINITEYFFNCKN